MAIFSLNHKFVGRSKSAPETASALALHDEVGRVREAADHKDLNDIKQGGIDLSKWRGTIASSRDGSHWRDDPGTRGPRKDGFDVAGSVALGVLGKISEWVESLMDGPSRRSTNDGKENDMADEKQRLAQRTAELQSRASQEEAASWKKAELEAYLKERREARLAERGR